MIYTNERVWEDFVTFSKDACEIGSAFEKRIVQTEADFAEDHSTGRETVQFWEAIVSSCGVAGLVGGGWLRSVLVESGFCGISI